MKYLLIGLAVAAGVTGGYVLYKYVTAQPGGAIAFGWKKKTAAQTAAEKEEADLLKTPPTPSK